MQVHAYLDETGDILIVEIPTSEGNLKTTFNYLDLNDSHVGNPLVSQMPDVHGSTVYARPLGEMPLKVQEEYTRKAQEDFAQQRLDEAAFLATQGKDADPIEGSGGDANSAPKEPAVSDGPEKTGLDPLNKDVLVDPSADAKTAKKK